LYQSVEKSGNFPLKTRETIGKVEFSKLKLTQSKIKTEFTNYAMTSILRVELYYCENVFFPIHSIRLRMIYLSTLLNKAIMIEISNDDR
jgi:hypothetical protein